jgi:hypothetical protein
MGFEPTTPLGKVVLSHAANVLERLPLKGAP